MTKRYYVPILFLAALLAGCASMFGPRQVSVPAEKMQASLERRFPVDRRLMEVFDVHLFHPRLSMLPAEDRIAVAMDARVEPRLGGGGWNGRLTVSGRLALDPAHNAVVLRDAKVDQFVLDDLDGDTKRYTERIARLLLGHVARDLTIYQFRPEQLRLAGVQFQPTHLTTTASSVEVTLDPVR